MNREMFCNKDEQQSYLIDEQPSFLSFDDQDYSQELDDSEDYNLSLDCQKYSYEEKTDQKSKKNIKKIKGLHTIKQKIQLNNKTHTSQKNTEHEQILQQIKTFFNNYLLFLHKQNIIIKDQALQTVLQILLGQVTIVIKNSISTSLAYAPNTSVLSISHVLPHIARYGEQYQNKIARSFILQQMQGKLPIPQQKTKKIKKKNYIQENQTTQTHQF